MELNIGKLKISGYVALAPMAGVADRAFRELCREYGAAYTCGELASAKGIVLGDPHSEAYLKGYQKEMPFGPQLFGSEPELMAKAAIKALEYNPNKYGVPSAKNCNFF